MKVLEAMSKCALCKSDMLIVMADNPEEDTMICTNPNCECYDEEIAVLFNTMLECEIYEN